MISEFPLSKAGVIVYTYFMGIIVHMKITAWSLQK